MNTIRQEGKILIVEYDLYSLPTAQHKAGLAGMLVMIDSLRLRKLGPIPEVTKFTATEAHIVFTQENLQTLFNDLYDALWVEIESKQKWKKEGKTTEPKRIEEKEIEISGKKKIEKRFIYDAVQPKGFFFQMLYPDGDGVWVKLWRDMLWKTLRGIPKTRLVYEERAHGKPSSLALGIWKSFLKFMDLQKKGKIQTESISSAIFIGAEDMNAEKVLFQGTVECNLLLHFWPIVSLIYVPRVLSLDRTQEQGLRIKRQENGYVLAVPEPADLMAFYEDVKLLFRGLDHDKTGIRPRSALIDLVEEGGLEYLYHFAKHKIEGREIGYSLCALELYHLQRQGNRIRQLAAERIHPQGEVLTDYERFRQVYRNPIYKSFYLQNLLNNKTWFEGADNFFNQYPMPVFIYLRDRTPSGIRFFGSDAKQKFLSIESNLRLSPKGGKMGEEERARRALRIFRLIQAYVNYRTEEKSGKKFKDFRNNKNEKKQINYPPEYREAREKVCTDAFLAIRSRRDQDFVEYFTGTICSVPQYLPEPDYLMVAQTLMQDWAEIKTLSMLAISANSYLPGTTESEEGEQS